MDNSMDKLFLFFVILYFISPIDFVPGPVDDVLLALFYFFNRQLP